MARKSYHDPRHTYLYFGVYRGISNGQVGRLTGSFLMGESGPSLELCQNISLAGLWTICIFGLLLFFLLSRSGVRARFVVQGDGFVTPGELDAGAVEAEAENCAWDAVDGAALSRDAFTAGFEVLASRIRLTQREREVVLVALHGYSRANIAKKLCLSPETVKTYLNRAYAKAGVTSKQELIALIEATKAQGFLGTAYERLTYRPGLAPTSLHTPCPYQPRP